MTDIKTLYVQHGHSASKIALDLKLDYHKVRRVLRAEGITNLTRKPKVCIPKRSWGVK